MASLAEGQQGGPAAVEGTKNKVWVGSLAEGIDSQKLKEAFAEFNPIDADVKIDKVSLKSRGFGFVAFSTEQDMEDAMHKMDGASLDGQSIKVKVALPHDEAPGGRRNRGGYRDSGYYRDSYRDDYDRGGRGRGRGYERRYDDYYERDRYYRDRYAPRGYEIDRGYDSYRGRGRSRYPPRGYDRYEPYRGYRDYDDRYERSYDRSYDRGYDRYESRPPPMYESRDYDRPVYGGPMRDRYMTTEYGGYGEDRYRDAGGMDRGYERGAGRPTGYDRPSPARAVS